MTSDMKMKFFLSLLSRRTLTQLDPVWIFWVSEFLQRGVDWSWSVLMVSEGPWTRTCSLLEIRVLCKTKKVERSHRGSKHMRRPWVICSQWRSFGWWDVSQSSLSLTDPFPNQSKPGQEKHHWNERWAATLLHQIQGLAEGLKLSPNYPPRHACLYKSEEK